MFSVSGGKEHLVQLPVEMQLGGERKKKRKQPKNAGFDGC